MQLGEICFTESTCSVGPELELDIAPPALSNLPLISTLLFTYLGEVRLASAHQLVLAGRGLEAGPAVPAAPAALLPRRNPSLAFARMKLSDFEEEAAPPVGAPPAVAGAAAPLVPVADAESACRQPVTVMLLLLLSSFCARSLSGRRRPRARRRSRGILRRARGSLRPEADTQSGGEN